MPSDTYRWLAKYYDHLFEFRRTFDTARAVIHAPLLPGVNSMCDLCCGSGTLAVHYAAQGIRTWAVDLSPEMCRVTRAKARQARVKVDVVCADMRTFRLPEPVDLITCEFDALNHVPKRSDLSRVLKSVARALRPGGHFVFDVNNKLAFERIWAKTWFAEKDPVAMVMQGGHIPGADWAWIDVEWFIRVGSTWRRHHEHIEEVCWTADEIREALAAAGFDKIRKWDAAPFFDDEHTRPGYRTFWRARKAPK